MKLLLAATAALSILGAASAANAQYLAGTDFQWSYGASSVTVNDTPTTRAIYGFTVTSPVPGFAMFWFTPNAPSPGVANAPVCIATAPTPSGAYQATIGYGLGSLPAVVYAATVGFSTGADCNTWSPYATNVHISVAKQ